MQKAGHIFVGVPCFLRPLPGSQTSGKPQCARRTRAAAENPETEGVRALIDRDRKTVELSDEDLFAEDSPTAKPTTDASKQPASTPAAGKQAVRARSQLIEAATSSSEAASREDGLRTASQAIAQGIAELEKGNAEQAIVSFQRALELPGRGAFRMARSPKEYSCASEGEERAALYNLACAYTALGKRAAALASLQGAIEIGFCDWQGLRSDPDLKTLQGPELEQLIRKGPGSQSGPLGFLDGLNPFKRK